MLRRARFFQVSSEKGFEEAQIPFDIAADFLPQPLSDHRLSGLMAGSAPMSATFDDIIFLDSNLGESPEQIKSIQKRKDEVEAQGILFNPKARAICAQTS